GGSYGILNTNRLLTGADGVKPHRGRVGSENGDTSHAGHTLAPAARRGGPTRVDAATTPHYGGTPARPEEARPLLHRGCVGPGRGGTHAVYEEARSLLDWGFEAAGRVDPVGSLDALRPGSEAGVAAGPEARTVAAASAGDGPRERPVAWTVAGAALLGAAAVA